MKKILSAIILLISIQVQAQTIVQRDPVIEKMVSEVSSDSLKSYINKLVSFGTRHTLSTTKDSRKGIGAAREWVVSKFKEFAAGSEGRMIVRLDKWTLEPDKKRVDVAVDMGNPMAILQGTDPNDKRIFIITGHLDSRRSDVQDRVNDAPGANDDGSGVAAVMECARVMSKNRFSATIIFAALSGEEQGLYGGERLSQVAKDSSWEIEGVLNNDIVGSNNSNETNIISNTQVRVFSEGLPLFEIEKRAKTIRSMGLENDGAARTLARYMKEIGERYVDNLQVVMVYRNDRFLRGGDHLPFVEKGFAAVRVTEMNENFEHQHQDIRKENGIAYGDLPEYMDFEYLRKNTAMNLCNLANLAKAPSKPLEVKIDVKGLSNSTLLSWKKPASGNVKGYYVLIRETYQPFWQKKIFTAAENLRIPYSKDNYFFAVQSVSPDGNESLPVLPEAAR
jgi:hypothetical protein